MTRPRHSLPNIEECVEAFKRGDHDGVVSTLKRIPVDNEVGSYKIEHFTLENIPWTETMFEYVYNNRNKNPSGSILPWNTAFGVRLLHLAAHYGWDDVVKKLLRKKSYQVKPNATTSKGETALHFAARQGHFQVVKFLCEEYKDIVKVSFSCVDHHNIPVYNSPTPLHYACGSGNLKIIKYLLLTVKFHPESSYSSGNRPLHFACLSGCLDAVKYILPFCKKFPNAILGRTCVDGCSPLELACASNSIELVRFLILRKGYDPTKYVIKSSKYGDTIFNPLQAAVRQDNVETVRFLLSTDKAEPSLLSTIHMHYNTYNKLTNCVYQPKLYGIAKSDEMRQILEPFFNPKEQYTSNIALRIFVVGNSKAGKSTLVKAMSMMGTVSNESSSLLSIEPNTAGIALTRTTPESSIGNALIHDFAGHHEYYSGHSALVEDVLKQSAALFLCVVDISQPDDTVKSQVTYWLDFLETKVKAETRKHSCLIVVGSHADKLSEKECTEKRGIAKEIAESASVGLKYQGFIHIDCRKVLSDDLQSLTSMIKNCFVHSRKLSVYSLLLNKYLFTEFKKDFCTVSELVTALKEKDCYYLPSGEEVIIGLLRELHNEGIIYFFEDCKWLVLKKEVLLTEVNGKLFAPLGFKEHVDIASNTGIVISSDLSKVFPHYNLDMLIGFLKQFDFCCEVDSEAQKQIFTNFFELSQSLINDQLIFFPAFVKVDCPDSIQLGGQGVPVFGCYFELEGSQGVFSTRFLHILLLQLAYKFALSPPKVSISNSSALNRRCSVWKNGIYWSRNGVETVVELTNQNRRVLLAMQYGGKPDALFGKIRSSIICEIISLQQRLCPDHKVNQYLISPMKYPLKHLPSDMCFNFVEVAKAIIQSHLFVVDCKEGLNKLKLTEELRFEPFRALSIQDIAQIFDTELINTSVPASILERVRDVAHINVEDGINYGTLRDQLNEMSVFAGRNPLVVANISEPTPKEDAVSHDQRRGGDSVASEQQSTEDETTPHDPVKLQVVELNEKLKNQEQLVENQRELLKEQQQQINELKEQFNEQREQLILINEQKGQLIDSLLSRVAVLEQLLKHGNEEGEEGVDQLCGGTKRISEDRSCSSQDHDQHGQDHHSLAHQSMPQSSQYNAPRILSDDDLKDVLEYIVDLKQAKIKALGLQLGLLPTTLDKLSDGTSPEEYNYKAMLAWLHQEDNVNKNGGATWRALITALRKKSVNCSVQAHNIDIDLMNGTIT